MPSVLVRLIVLLLGSGLAVAAIGADTRSGVTWEHLRVDARLDEAGLLQVRETHDLRVRGDVDELRRVISVAPEQRLRILGAYRLAEDGGEVPLSQVDELFAPEQYVDHGWHLRWSLPDEGQRSRSVAMRFRIDYEIARAVVPVWDIPHANTPYDRHLGPEWLNPWQRAREVLSHWREVADCLGRCYRLDHDIHFPTRDAGPAFRVRELSYQLAYADNWRLLFPERELATVDADVNYRVQRVFEYLEEGIPPTANHRAPRIRFGAILAIPALCALLLVPIVAFRVPRWARQVRIDRAWFTSEILSSPPELIATWRREAVPRRVFEPMLERLAAEGKLRIDYQRRLGNARGDAVHLRLTVDPETLHPVERTVIGLLLHEDERELHSDVHRARYPQGGFDPNAFATALLRDVAFPKAVQVGAPLWTKVMLQGLSAAAVVLVIYDILVHDALIYAGMAGGIVATLAALAALLAARWWHPARSVLAAGVWIVPILLAMVCAVTLHVVPSTPLSAASSVGLTLFAAAGFVYALMHTRGFDESMERRYWMLQARNWARRQLRSPHPQLETWWAPHLSALGLGRDVKGWRIRRGTQSAGSVGSSGAPRPSLLPDEAWSVPLYVNA